MFMVFLLVCSIVCQGRIDLAFVIDASGSIESSGRGNFKRCLDFVKRLVASFKISRKYTRVGAVVYSSRARKVFGFNRYNNKRLLVKAIDRIPYLRRGTRTGYALSFAQRYLFRGRSRRRKQVLIVMTDGRSGDRVRGRALALHRSGIETFAIGIGKNYDIRQLIQIASTKRHVYVARFRSLPNIVRVIKSKACKGMLFLQLLLFLSFFSHFLHFMSVLYQDFTDNSIVHLRNRTHFSMRYEVMKTLCEG